MAYHGIPCTVDAEQRAIASCDVVYRFTLGRSGFTVTCPGSFSYFWFDPDMAGWSDDYDPARYISGNILREVLLPGRS